MKIRRLHLKRVLTGAILGALISQSALAANLSGKWYGHYVCEQGITALTLSISEEDQSGPVSTLSADFSFYAHPDNPYVPSGSYAMTGIHTLDDEQFTLKGVQWDFKPFGYEMVDLEGAFKREGDTDILEGEVYFGSPDVRFGCSTFYLERIGANQNLF